MIDLLSLADSGALVCQSAARAKIVFLKYLTSRRKRAIIKPSKKER